MKLDLLHSAFSDTQNPVDSDGYTYIDILLTRYPDRLSGLIRLLTRNYFSHTSIGLGDSTGTFYSLVTKGFRLEQPYRRPSFKGKEIPCRLYRLRVSPEIYETISETLNYHLEKSKKYKYSYFGVSLCILHISLKRENRYFCSQFVSEVLEHAKAAKLKKHSTLCLPDDFMQMKELALHFSGTLRDLIAAHPALAPVCG